MTTTILVTLAICLTLLTGIAIGSALHWAHKQWLLASDVPVTEFEAGWVDAMRDLENECVRYGLDQNIVIGCVGKLEQLYREGFMAPASIVWDDEAAVLTAEWSRPGCDIFAIDFWKDPEWLPVE